MRAVSETQEFEPFGAPKPESFGPYVVLGELGTGGMGVVYRALDTRLQRQVALKVLHRELAVSGPRERFLREARLVSSLNHPNICTIYDIGEQDGDPYLVLELLEGENLKDRMMRGPIPAEDIREVAFRVGLALQAAHARGIVHRDIKPANLFLVNDGRGSTDVKVLDFGLAKLADENRQEGQTVDDLTRLGATVGTVEYMSPEQACGEPLDARSDLFSLGAVLYEMATGAVPFRGATSAVIFSELLNRDPIPPREKNLQVPASLDRLIRALLTKDRSRRLQSASALLDALSQASREAAAHGRAPLPIAAAVPVPAVRTVPVPAVRAVPVPAVRAAKVPPLATTVGPAGDSGTPPLQRTSAPAAVTPREPASVTPREPAAVSDPQPSANLRARVSAAAGLHLRTVPSAGHNQPGPQPDGVHTGWKVALAAGVVVALLVTLLVILLLSRRPTAAAFDGRLQVMPLQNRTGETALDRAPTAALVLLLAQSPRLAVRRPAPADMLTPGSSDSTDGRLRSADGQENLAVLTGVLTRTPDGYRIHLHASDAMTHASLADTEDTASSAADLPALLGRVALQLRQQLGETPDAVAAVPSSLADNGSTSLAALDSFSRAEAHAGLAEWLPAIVAYRAALDLDPNFQAARIRLAAALWQVHADAQATAAAQVLQQQPAVGGPHLRNERAWLLASTAERDGHAGQTGSAVQVAEQWRTDTPRDAEAQEAAAASLLGAGRWGEAVQAASAAVALDPFDRTAQDVLTAAELAAGHPDVAWADQARAYRLGAGSAALSLQAAAVRRDAAGVTASRANLESLVADVSALWAQAAYLASTGEVGQAQAVLAQAAALASRHPEIASAAAAADSRASLLAALSGDCQSPSRGTGPDKTLADTWCKRPLSAAATDVGAAAGLPAAVLQWAAGDLQGALTTLEVDEAERGNSLATLVRGRLHAALRQPGAAIADYKAVVLARASADTAGTMAYPVALAALAGQYAATGDVPNSTAAAASLHALWPNRAAADRLLSTMARG